MAPSDTLQQTRELRRRKREHIIMAVLLVIVVAVTFLEAQVVHLPHDLPLGSSLLVFALINLNTLLLLLLIFLVFRNLFKLTVERRKGVWGSQLRTKLVVTFVILSLAPTILLFFAAFQFVGTSIEYWFSVQVEGSLMEALESSENYHQQLADGTLHFAELVAADLGQRGPLPAGPSKLLGEFLEIRRAQYGLTAVRVLLPDLSEVGHAIQSGTHLSHLDYLPLDLVTRVLTGDQPLSLLQAAPTGDFLAAVQPLPPPNPKAGGRALGAVVAFKFLPNGSLARVQGVQKGLENYRQLKSLKNPIKTNQYITLSIVTLLIIFAGTWFGFHLAKTITVPLMEVAQGTQRIVGGDYDFHIDMEGPDEIGALVNAFNRMTADLKTSKARLDEAQEEMRRTNLELEQRRRYMEIVLKNVAAGVVAVDARGIVTTFNPSAERLLKVQSATVLGSHWRNVVDSENLELVERLLGNLSTGSRRTVDQQMRLNIDGEALTLMVHLGFMCDDAGQALGMVVVFEDLSELEKAQRMAAWREVARRIAHEVKNPLTPIKLSAQRLVRRYEEHLGDDAKIFHECTSTIIHQVEELRRLVNEFSTFARLPSVRLALGDLSAIAEEALSLFRTGHRDISFEMEAEEGIPIFDLDHEQMSRAIINLMDNAVAALEESLPPKQVVVRLSYDDILKIVRLEVEDSGPGVSATDRLRLFEPYYSTKKGGTGLGLAIVSTIVSDHNGYIRVQDNQPHGTRIIIELPARGARVAV
ncbi:two-component system, NtrC family, nitrogen regulation sensor histidine kinase NtrY [Desulfarculales bacterium]